MTPEHARREIAALEEVRDELEAEWGVAIRRRNWTQAEIVERSLCAVESDLEAARAEIVPGWRRDQ